MDSGNPDCIQATNLRATIQAIDGIAQQGFKQIAAQSKACLLLLERPDREDYLIGLVDTLMQSILDLATTSADVINAEAESVGADYVDHTEQRRMWPPVQLGALAPDELIAPA